MPILRFNAEFLESGSIAMISVSKALAAGIVAAVAVTFPVSFASAQNLDAGAIEKSLTAKPKTRSLTRSFSGDAAAKADAEFLNSLPTRGIKIEMRKKLDEIVAKQELPKIDITINFDFNSDQIRPDAFAVVDELGKALSSDALAKSRIAINGHTDAVGSDPYNQNLSDRRAASVRAYLIQKFGIAEDRLIAIGYGEERLKNVGDPFADENRRVEVINLTQG
jgi:outer membrane protein OmpA-like peptidoglycan-associated protein